MHPPIVYERLYYRVMSVKEHSMLGTCFMDFLISPFQIAVLQICICVSPIWNSLDSIKTFTRVVF